MTSSTRPQPPVQFIVTRASAVGAERVEVVCPLRVVGDMTEVRYVNSRGRLATKTVRTSRIQTREA